MFGRFGVQFDLDRAHTGHDVEYRFFRQLGKFIHEGLGFGNAVGDGLLAGRGFSLGVGFSTPVLATGNEQRAEAQQNEKLLHIH